MGAEQVENENIARWQECVGWLQNELPAEEFESWVKPLQVRGTDDGVKLLAPNKWVERKLRRKYLRIISEHCGEATDSAESMAIELEVGDLSEPAMAPKRANGMGLAPSNPRGHALNGEYTFDAFVEGNSNQWAKAASTLVATKPGGENTPFLLYGGPGLGKTHLIHAIGHEIRRNFPQANILYETAQTFVEDMVYALRGGTMQRFVQSHRQPDALLIDDIHEFAKKVKSQEEFFNIFNRLYEKRRQIVLTSDRYPRDLEGLDERLMSRFVSGQTASLEPPDVETRTAILMKKGEAMEAAKLGFDMKVASFMARYIRSNVRDLQGALKRVVATARFMGSRITVDYVKHTLRDLLSAQDRRIRIGTIQETVADYYHIKRSDMLSKRRTRNVVRPRQMAMHLCRELTNRSLPEIGEAFGGRDHTTVLHGWRKIRELVAGDQEVARDHRNLNRILSS